jgi:hypothetical protein
VPKTPFIIAGIVVASTNDPTAVKAASGGGTDKFDKLKPG